jgi:PIN domain nuclease of toxin-antitoxin system
MGRSLLILLDTHVLLWLAMDQSRISKKAGAAIDGARQSGSGLAISDMTLLEVAQLAHRGRISIPTGVESFLSEVERRFAVLAITARIAAQAFSLPASYPSDPADRVIGATAMVEGISLITADRAIRESGDVSTIW